MYHFFSAIDTTQIRNLDLRGNSGCFEFTLSEATWPGLSSSLLDGEFPNLVGIKVDLPSNFGTWLELIKEARNAGHLLHFNAMSFWVAEGTFAPLHGVPAVSERIQHYATLFLQLGVLFSIQERLPLCGARSSTARRWPPNHK